MNPIEGNRFSSRAESGEAAVALWKPLLPYFSKGKGRVDLGQTAAHFTKTAAELEGFARPLFGLVPLNAGGLPFDHWQVFVDGFANGADPSHEDYWGVAYDFDQRIVESAALGFSLALAPDTLWAPLSDRAKDNVATWLKHILTLQVPTNNWNFFLVLVSLGLERVGVDHSLEVRERALQTLESYYVDDGWYSDGPNRRFDHYIGFAMHFYGLIYTKLAPDDTARNDRFRERAAEFATDFRDWFADDGAGLAFGRSMTYRFAQAAFWASLAYADVEALPWGEVRGIWARNMRWWGDRDYFDRDGVMSIGYCYPTLHMSENYNSPGSPYWAMKSFLPLALSDDHPFWATPEEPGRPVEGVKRSRTPGFVTFGEPNNTVFLSSGNVQDRPMRSAQDKYGKFAYATHFGFSVDGDARGFETNAYDNMLVFSDDGRYGFQRNVLDDARIGEDFIYSRWRPCHGVEVETWLIARPLWHVRVHVIRCDRPFHTLEAGFGIERTDLPPGLLEEEQDVAWVRTDAAGSAIVNLAETSSVSRAGQVRRAMASTALHYPRAHVPQLHVELPAGEHVLACAVFASPNEETIDSAREETLEAPSVDALREMLDRAEEVGAQKNPVED
ncbi:DUF2264 domain-containing protein [Bauldia sp.]|uniref:DUF2264 domain-containing protein n=1 Tax=Bauldia sp. TaxID=2575872 RepID=UPI003BAAF920